MGAFPSDADRLNPVALITGAASEIGQACARGLAGIATGGLILIDLDEAALSAAADALKNPPERVSTLAFDAADSKRWTQAAGFIADHFGRLDWAILNAEAAPAEASLWQRFKAPSLDNVFVALRALTPLMRANAQGGAVVVSAPPGMLGSSAEGAKTPPQAGLLEFMRVAAKQGAAGRIRVNAAAVGGAGTPLLREAPLFQDLVRDAGNERAAFLHIAGLSPPLARYAGGDLAGPILRLLTESAPITGATLVVDGPYTL